MSSNRNNLKLKTNFKKKLKEGNTAFFATLGVFGFKPNFILKSTWPEFSNSISTNPNPPMSSGPTIKPIPSLKRLCFLFIAKEESKYNLNKLPSKLKEKYFKDDLTILINKLTLT